MRKLTILGLAAVVIVVLSCGMGEREDHSFNAWDCKVMEVDRYGSILSERCIDWSAGVVCYSYERSMTNGLGVGYGCVILSETLLDGGE